MATDTAKTPAARLNELRREWGIGGDETGAQAQGKALAPLGKWLQSGEGSPEVVVRAVQILLANPEHPGVDQRAAISQVASRVAAVWKTAGQDRSGLLALQAALIAIWPYGLTTGGFSVAELFESAWGVVGGRDRQQAKLTEWRDKLRAESVADGSEVGLVTMEAPKVSSNFTKLDLPETSLANARAVLSPYPQSAITHIVDSIESYKDAFAALDTRTKTLGKQCGDALSTLTGHVNHALQTGLKTNLASMSLLWWGQSRYSHGARTPYRRIQDETTRLWWMAWEASEVAVDLDVEPAASFLVEVLHQLGEKVDEKRTLMTWLSELVRSLRMLHENNQYADAVALGEKLKEIASKDPLGMPVTWARLEAISTRNQTATLEERARRDIALDLDTLIDRGDWAVWLFREALLDRHLREA